MKFSQEEIIAIARRNQSEELDELFDELHDEVLEKKDKQELLDWALQYLDESDHIEALCGLLGLEYPECCDICHTPKLEDSNICPRCGGKYWEDLTP